MSKFIQLEYSTTASNGRYSNSETMTDFVIVNLDNIIAIHVPNRTVVLPEEHRFRLTERGWEVLILAISMDDSNE